VILVDSNLLVYAHGSSLPQHAGAKAWLDAQLNGETPVGLPWPSLLAFLRLVTNPRVFGKPEPLAEARRRVTDWLDRPVVWIPQPTERHREILENMLVRGGVQGNLVPDAHLAALAIEHGLVLCSTDRDFTRFPDLRWRNPLQI